MKPVVDRLEEQYQGRVEFIRLNIQEQVGMDLAPVYNFQYTPTFIFFNEKGEEIWRDIGTLDETRFDETMLAYP